jgi:hypothetical protein
MPEGNGYSVIAYAGFVGDGLGEGVTAIGVGVGLGLGLGLGVALGVAVGKPALGLPAGLRFERIAEFEPGSNGAPAFVELEHPILAREIAISAVQESANTGRSIVTAPQDGVSTTRFRAVGNTLHDCLASDAIESTS